MLVVEEWAGEPEGTRGGRGDMSVSDEERQGVDEGRPEGKEWQGNQAELCLRKQGLSDGQQRGHEDQRCQSARLDEPDRNLQKSLCPSDPQYGPI